ncbi:phage tail protein, partial [Aestuariivita sp.]|uniref:phage tail protein n=1 Tax=Aestuariivita sp. TaxID=1872407 RepID=UPI00216F764F
MPPVGAFFAGLAGAGLAAGLAGTAAASTWLAGVTVGKFLTSTVGRLLVTVALSALQAAQMDKPTSQVAGLRTSQTMTGGTNPASFVIGAEYATDGQLVTPPMSHGSAGGLPNAYLNYVIELSDLPLSGLNMLVLDGELVELGTQAHADYGLPVLGRFADHAWVRFYDGTQTAADPMLMDRYGDYERPWGSDRIGAGIAYAVLTFRYNREIFVQFPRVRFVVGGIPLYDARKDSSVGGVGAHRWADPASWEPSSNTAVQIYNILRGIDLGDGHIWGGGAEAEDLPLDIWWAAMNACDVQIERADGSFENAYRSAFEIAVSDEPASVIDELLKACGGRMAEVGGAYKIRVGGTGLPVFYFTDDDVVVSETQSFTPFPTANSIYNGVHASYPDPDAAWQSREAPARYNLIYELEDGGQRRVADLRLPTAPYPDQVQRLQLSYLKNERRARQHSLTLGPDATQLEPLDVVGYSSGRNGYISKSFELTATTDPLITGNPTLGLRETDPGDYDWSPTFTLPSSAPASRKVPIPTLSVPGFNAFAFVQTDALEIERRVQIRIVWNADAIEAPGIRWEVRLRTTGQQVTQGSTSRMAAGEAFISEGLIPDTDYEVRAELVTSLPSVPTGWILVHTDDVRLTIADLSAEVFQAIDDDARATASSLIAAFELETIQPIADLIPPITADIARIDVEIGSIQADIPEILQDIGRIDIDLELKDVRQQSIFDTLDRIGQNLLWAMTKVSSTESTLRGAGIYEDPDEGTIRIAAFDGLQTDIAAKFSEVQISLDAQNAAISLTATQTWVNQQLAQATLDPSFTPLIDDLELQVATAQVDIDALEAAVTLKADVTTVDGLNVRLDSAKVDIDALQTAIVLKVETTDFTALETRVSSAEVQLGTLDAPSITQTVADVRYLQQGQTDADAATLAQLIQGYRDRKAVSQSLAYVQQDMRALVGEDREAIASLKVSFGAQIDSNVALIERETTARATADEALAADILTLQATTDATMASITALNDVSAASDSPAARAIHQVQLDLVVVEEDVTLTAAAVSAVETRVAQTEDGLAVSGRRFDSLSVSTAEADADADIVSLRAAVDLYNARRDLGEAIAISAQDMRALVVEDRVAIASLETLLAAAINNTAASLKSEQLVRSEADDALAQDIVTIKASLESAEGDIAATATV